MARHNQISQVTDFLLNQPRPTRKFLLYLYWSVIAIFATFPFSVIGVDDLDKITVVTFRLDHVVHVLAFIPSLPLFIWSVQKPSRAQLAMWAGILAISAEFIQYFLPYRSYNTSDLLANLTGMILGWLMLTGVERAGWINLGPATEMQKKGHN